MNILIGIIVAAIGLGVCFFGLRYWFILLPIFGALTGFFLGVRVVVDLFGTGFLATSTSWIVGAIVGVAFALLSWFVWYVGAIVMAGAVGASLFSGLLYALFTTPWGLAVFLAAAAGALIFALGALLLNLPIYIVIVNSVLGGAALAIAGTLMIFGIIPATGFANGAAVAMVDASRLEGMAWVWSLGWLILVSMGAVYQIRSVNEVRLPDDKWVPARAPA